MVNFMRVSLSIIAEYLKKKYPSTNLVRSEHENILGARIWNSLYPTYDTNYLYICFFPDINFLPENGMNFILIGGTNINFSNTNHITIIEKVDIKELYEYVMIAIENVRNWHNKLLKSIIYDNDIQTLLNISSDIFKNPLLVFDPWRTTIAYKNYSTESSASNNLKISNSFEIHDSKIVINFDVFNEVHGKDYLKYLDTLTSPKYFINEKLRKPYIVSNIKFQGKLMGLLLIFEQNKAIDNLDLLLSSDLTDSLIAVLNQTNNFEHKIDQMEDLFFIDALKGKIIHQPEYYLQQLGWRQNDKYVIAVIRERESNNSFSEKKSFFKYRLIKMHPEIKVLTFESSIVLISNIKKGSFYTKISMEFLFDNFKKRNLICGFSKVFDSFLDIHFYYQQASYAASRFNINEDNIFFYYKDNITNHLLDTFLNCYELPYFMHPDIDELIKHDVEHGSNLIDTFYTYLMNNKSYVACTKKLHVSKGALVYRIKLIKDIVKSDYDDEKTKLNLILSIQMYYKMKNNKHIQ